MRNLTLLTLFLLCAILLSAQSARVSSHPDNDHGAFKTGKDSLTICDTVYEYKPTVLNYWDKISPVEKTLSSLDVYHVVYNRHVWMWNHVIADVQFSSSSFSKALAIQNDTSRNFTSFKNVYHECKYYENRIDNLSFMLDTFRNYPTISRGEFSNLSFSNVQFNDIVTIQNCKIKKLQLDEIETNAIIRVSPLQIDTVSITSGDEIRGVIDLSAYQLRSGAKRCQLDILGCDVSRIKFDFSNFDLLIDKSISEQSRLNFYRRLLRNQEQNDFKEGYARLDTLYRNANLRNKFNVQDYFSKIWWNYGYDKGLIFIWTGILFSIFFIVNLFAFAYLNDKVYILENLKARAILERREARQWYLKGWYRFWFSLLYSLIIFFGLKIDMDKMRFSNIFWVVYIYTFYVLGLVCLVFIGNYFLFK